MTTYHGWWESNLGSLEEQYRLLNSKLSRKSSTCIFNLIGLWVRNLVGTIADPLRFTEIWLQLVRALFLVFWGQLLSLLIPAEGRFALLAPCILVDCQQERQC